MKLFLAAFLTTTMMFAFTNNAIAKDCGCKDKKERKSCGCKDGKCEKCKHEHNGEDKKEDKK